LLQHFQIFNILQAFEHLSVLINVQNHGGRLAVAQNNSGLFRGILALTV